MLVVSEITPTRALASELQNLELIHQPGETPRDAH